MQFETIRWDGELPGRVTLLDQTLLPGEVRTIHIERCEEMFDAIRRLAVRGAPAIGIAAAYGVLLGLQTSRTAEPRGALRELDDTCRYLESCRPTAINLSAMLQRMQRVAREAAGAGADGDGIRRRLLEEARRIHEEDRDLCRRMGEAGHKVLSDGNTVLTHCNAGALATGGIGTALGVIYTAVDRGKRIRVFADETRPLLQGARLTAWELAGEGIEVTLITDNMVAHHMQRGCIDLVLVGADRIAENGDVANKIGTLGVAILAKEHGIPFYVAAPSTSFDLDTPSGKEIPIEERSPEELFRGFSTCIAPREGVEISNPAFDVTPAKYITGIITEFGILQAPSREKVHGHLGKQA